MKKTIVNPHGFALKSFCDKENDCISYLAKCLNKGHLGLFLGAGVSKDVGLPNWPQLVYNCLNEISPSEAKKVFTPRKKKDLSNEDLKSITQTIKDKCRDRNKDFQTLVSKNLYKTVKLNFIQAKKELLIAISALTFGKVRGNVKTIVTYNFDSILEWYLSTNGLNVNVFDKKNLIHDPCDINIIHTHGYLPYSPEHGKMSDKIIFTSEEFTDKWNSDNYSKEIMYDFFRQHIFLAVGLSPDSVINDICPYLRYLDSTWYINEGIKRRGHPYGVAFFPNYNAAQRQKLIEYGIIPCKVSDLNKIPTLLFGIAQKAANGKILSV